MTLQDIPSGPGELSPAAVDLYARIVRGDQPGPEHSAAERELWAWGVVSADPEQPNVLVALDPRQAAARQLKADAQAMAARVARLMNLPEMAGQLIAHFDRAKGQPGTVCEFVDDPAIVNARLSVAVAQAREEILSAQPGGRRTKALRDIALERDPQAVARGVTLKTLYRDSVRQDALTREWAGHMTGLGAQIRTLAGPFQRCIIIDRQQAFISDYTNPDAPPHAAWIVNDAAVVGYMAAVFDETWRRGDPWTGDAHTAGCGIGVGVGPKTTRRQREMLRDMCEGMSQDSIADRLGWSRRAVAREFEKLRHLFGVKSTQQLAYEWALSPERLIDDVPAIAQGDVDTAA